MNAGREAIHPPMTLEEVRALVRTDMESVNKVIRARLKRKLIVRLNGSARIIKVRRIYAVKNARTRGIRS